ncbi:hypothetical protein [Aliarcobacter butzleri]
MKASSFIQTIDKVACLEEIAYEMGYISKEKLLEPLKKNQYLISRANQPRRMIFLKTSIPDVVIIEPKVHGDARGYFVELIN